MNDPQLWLRAWFAAWVFWVGVASGSAGLLLLRNVSGGSWSAGLGERLEKATALLPLLAVAALPIIIAAPTLYGEALHRLSFAIRLAGYFAAWWALTFMQRSRPSVSAPGLILFVAVSTIAWWDLAMRLEPGFRSAAFGLLLISGHAASALAAALITSPAAQLRKSPAPATLLLTLSLLWGYVGFSQFLVVWSANLPQEASWYLSRTAGGWRILILALVTLHIAVPLLLLITRFGRHTAMVTRSAAASVLVGQMLYSILLIAPAAGHGPDFRLAAYAGTILLLGVIVLAGFRLTAKLPSRSTPAVT